MLPGVRNILAKLAPLYANRGQLDLIALQYGVAAPPSPSSAWRNQKRVIRNPSGYLGILSR